MAALGEGDLDRGGERIVPLDLELPPTARALVISGPNAGGKSVALKSVGVFCLLAQCGWDVPAREDTVLPLVTRLLVDLGDDQSIAESLSSFSAHLRHLGEFLPQAGTGTLVLCDEIGSGTDPQEGTALAFAVLEQLADAGRGCWPRPTSACSRPRSTTTPRWSTRPWTTTSAICGRCSPSGWATRAPATPSTSPRAWVSRPTCWRGRGRWRARSGCRSSACWRTWIAARASWPPPKPPCAPKPRPPRAATPNSRRRLKGLKQESREMMRRARREAEDLVRDGRRTIENVVREIRTADGERTVVKSARDRIDRLGERLRSEAGEPSGAGRRRCARSRSGSGCAFRTLA